ncbi:hypothetical protein FOA23_07470 [Bacillus pumilus]
MVQMMEKEVNPHFEDFLFDWKFQFLVGGYGSSKSYPIALKLILKLLDEKRTALVIREVYDTYRDSTFSLFEEIVLDHVIQCRTSPLMLKFHNGSRIIFKGLDKPATTDDETVQELIEFAKTKELIKADAAEPKTIAYLWKMGYNMVAARKFQGSRLQYTKKIKRFKKIICSVSCKNNLSRFAQ